MEVLGALIVSIHAPARGATKVEKVEANEMMFQSTHPRGVRLHLVMIPGVMMGFNPRTREGCDQRNFPL